MVKARRNTLRAFYMRFAHRASSCAFPSAGRPRRHTAFIITHCGAVQKRERIQIPDWRAENGDSVVHPPSRFYPFGTSQPSHASGRTRMKSSQSVALLSSSVKTYARTSVKPVSPIKCPYTACPSRIAAKETPYPGRVISWPFPASKELLQTACIPPSFSLPLREVRAAFKCHQAASPESKRFPDPMQLPRKDNTAPLSSWGYPPHGPA